MRDTDRFSLFFPYLNKRNRPWISLVRWLRIIQETLDRLPPFSFLVIDVYREDVVESIENLSQRIIECVGVKQSHTLRQQSKGNKN